MLSCFSLSFLFYIVAQKEHTNNPKGLNKYAAVQEQPHIL